MAENSPLLRGRRQRASRDELHPKGMIRSSSVAEMGAVAEDEEEAVMSTGGEHDVEHAALLHEVRSDRAFVTWPSTGQSEKDSESPMLRASTMASRPSKDSRSQPGTHRGARIQLTLESS